MSSMKDHKPKRVRGNFKDITWGKLGFISADKEEGDSKKYRALCIHCKKYQSNTSIDRLIIHRKSCQTYRADLTEELGKEMIKREVCAPETPTAEPKTPTEPVIATETIELSSTNLLDKLMVEDDCGRGTDSTWVGYLNDLDQLVTLPPSDTNRLQKDLIKAETEYLETKSAYFVKLNEIAELKRTVTMLTAKKTQLEIAKLRAECE
ncbi:hypothetical protein KR009_004168 [Drosophila setifemur]|nr:hypothetical protein KR009_004168 [Drosophila setifemur]